MIHRPAFLIGTTCSVYCNGFAVQAFQNIQNIGYYVGPFRTSQDEDEDDSDLGEFDDPDNPQYPSYLFDLTLSRRYQQLEDAERHQEVQRWKYHVPSE
jgi:hypothetical protein